MPRIPEWNLEPLKPVYYVGEGSATIRQKSYILTLCARRKLPIPDLKNMTKKQAAGLISNMTNR